MKKGFGFIKNCLISLFLLIAAFAVSLLLHYIFEVQTQITAVFVFAVFLISLLTTGYLFGILSAFAATIAVNYAFTFPYFVLNFTIPENFISGIIMIVISILTSALVTKLKRHEAIKAEGEKERMRANLLRAVSHDLRTPLTTIYASSTTLLDNKATMTDKQKDKITAGIKEDAEWLMRMVENLLSITRIDSGTVKILKVPTVLEELIDAVLLKFRKRYPMQKVDIEIPEEIVVIPMDAILIEQVLVNILENAVYHASGMTELTLRVSIDDRRAVFEVADNGCGIASERLDNLFSGYHSTMRDEPSDSQGKNAGIGLSVCATIIKAHGGEIKAENRKTGGAVFRFILDTEDEEYDTE